MSSAWAIIEHQDKVLFVRRAPGRGRAGQWCLPGGTIWKNERPDVACVREAFEETGLRVTIRRPVAVFRDANYFLCTLATPCDLNLRTEECSDGRWIAPTELLRLGTVMDLRRIIPLLELAGLPAPPLPHGLKAAIPEETGHDPLTLLRAL